MTHNFAPNVQLTYYFKTLSNNRSENSTSTTPQALTDSVQLSDFGEYTPQAFANSDGAFYPSGIWNGCYVREIFVAASGPNHPDHLDKAIRL